jgi:hypothetical protein
MTSRIKYFIDNQGLSLAEFDKKISASTGYISKQIRNGGSIGGDLLSNMIKAFPKLNPAWLLVGEGKMLLDSADSNIEPDAIAAEFGQDIKAYILEIKDLRLLNHFLSEQNAERGKMIEIQFDLITKLKS